MSMIHEFVEKVLSSDEAFVLENKNTYTYFIQGKVGDGKYVYCRYGFKKDFYTELNEGMKLVAIVANDTVYIIDEFRLDLWGKSIDLPDHTALFKDYVKKVNEHVGNTVFLQFCAGLDVSGTEVDVKRCKEVAREYLITNRPYQAAKYVNMFDMNEVAQSLCGFINADEEAKRRYEIERDKWADKIARDKMVEAVMNDPSVAEEWELRMAQALNSLEAKTVNVEFEFNGKRAAEKIQPYEIVRVLLQMDGFSSYNFCNTKSAKMMMTEIGASTWSGDKNSLRCKNISRITYGKKVVYEKE